VANLCPSFFTSVSTFNKLSLTAAFVLLHNFIYKIFTFEITKINPLLTTIKQIFYKNKSTVLYGVSLAVLLFLLKWLELRFVVFRNYQEFYIGAIAVIFTALGIWLALKLSKPKVNTVIIEKEVFVTQPAEFVLNQAQVEKSGLSKREIEVLQLMAQGFSNNEIAQQLFLSLSTVKTHVANLFLKLDARRRTQAIEIAKRLDLIP
jgi:two-component system, NarL family, response regulator LiaR